MNSLKSKDGWMIIKIDIKKAFDSIAWDFIETMLTNYNFPLTLKNLIMSCIKNTTYTPIINGKKTQSFTPSKRIRQGDPIFPYIFILGMELISHLINKEIISKNWIPFTFKNIPPQISQLLFAYDILLFAKANQKNLHSILNVITTFTSISGLHLNLTK